MALTLACLRVEAKNLQGQIQMQDLIRRCWNDDVFWTILLPFIGMMSLIASVIVLLISGANATWKPEYGKSPPAVQLWFQNAQTTLESRPRINYIMCCEQSERLRTKFVGSKEGEWSYYPNPNCVSAGCPLFSIPNDVVHADRIKAIDPKDDDLPEFKQMRREGVLFIYHGQPTCFWPPEPST